jgi:hypothetical protein
MARKRVKMTKTARRALAFLLIKQKQFLTGKITKKEMREAAREATKAGAMKVYE